MQDEEAAWREPNVRKQRQKQQRHHKRRWEQEGIDGRVARRDRGAQARIDHAERHRSGEEEQPRSTGWNAIRTSAIVSTAARMVSETVRVAR